MLNLSKLNIESPICNYLLSHDLQAPNHPITKSGSTKPFVLVLGNDRDTRFLFKTACEIWNYDVAEADGCQQCLSIAAFKVPDLILLDSEIEFQSSLERMKELQRLPVFKECGFVFISGHAQDSVRQTALNAGANFFLVKPVDFDLLEKFLRSYFREKNSAVSDSP